jgi:hypothetical protein
MSRLAIGAAWLQERLCTGRIGIARVLVEIY